MSKVHERLAFQKIRVKLVISLNQESIRNKDTSVFILMRHFYIRLTNYDLSYVTDIYRNISSRNNS